jgi:hypothetical protein
VSDKKQRQKCAFPSCERMFIPEQGQPPVCPYHTKFMEDWAWCATHIQFKQAQPVQKKPALIIPGMDVRGIKNFRGNGG